MTVSATEAGRRQLSVLTLVLASLHVPMAALAQSAPPSGASVDPDAAARTHFDRGVSLYSAHDYGGALAEFLAAYEIGHRPTVLFNIAVTQRALHHYPEAARTIEVYLRSADLPRDRREQLEAALAELQGYVGHITLSGLAPNVVVHLDGEPLASDSLGRPIAVSTGQHVVEATATGFSPGRATVIVAGGQVRDVAMEMHALASETPSGPPQGPTVLVHASRAGTVVELDGASVAPDAEVSAAVGLHAVRARAPGFESVERRIELTANSHSRINVRLGRAGWGPAPLVIGVGVTAAVAIVAAVMSGVTVDTYNQFHMLTQMDPTAVVLSNRGSTEETVTNVLWISSGVAAVATVVLATQTQFGHASSIDVAVGPASGNGISGAVRVRF